MLMVKHIKTKRLSTQEEKKQKNSQLGIARLQA